MIDMVMAPTTLKDQSWDTDAATSTAASDVDVEYLKGDGVGKPMGGARATRRGVHGSSAGGATRAPDAPGGPATFSPPPPRILRPRRDAANTPGARRRSRTRRRTAACRRSTCFPGPARGGASPWTCSTASRSRWPSGPARWARWARSRRRPPRPRRSRRRRQARGRGAPWRATEPVRAGAAAGTEVVVVQMAEDLGVEAMVPRVGAVAS